MDKKQVEKISQKVYRQFPELDGKRPKISQPKSMDGPSGSNYLLMFSGKAKNAAGHSFNKQVRVIARPDGSIVKISSSK